MLVVAVLVVYGSTLSYGYNLDDTVLTQHEVFLSGEPSLARAFRMPYQQDTLLLAGQPELVQTGYRPVAVASMVLEHHLGQGGVPQFSHLVNVALYTASVLLLWVALGRLFGSWGIAEASSIAWVVTLLFLLHPLHTEVVCSIKNRDELLAFFFFLLGAIAQHKGSHIFTPNPRGQRALAVVIIALSVGFYVLSGLSKPTMLLLLPVVPLGAWLLRHGLAWWRYLALAAPLGLATLAVLGLRMLVVAGSQRAMQPFENPLQQALPLLEKVAFAPVVFWHQLKLLLWPHPLRFYYGYNQIPQLGWADPLAWLGLAVLLALLVLVYKLRKPLPLVAAAVVLLAWLPLVLSNPLAPLPGILSERNLFVPVLGICIILVWVWLRAANTLAQRLPAPLTVLLAGVLLLLPLLTYASLSSNRVQAWATPASLIKADAATSPEAYWVQWNYAKMQVAHLRNVPPGSYPLADYLKVAALLERLTSQLPQRAEAWALRAEYVLFALGQAVEATGFARRAATLVPTHEGYPLLWLEAGLAASKPAHVQAALGHLAQHQPATAPKLLAAWHQQAQETGQALPDAFYQATDSLFPVLALQPSAVGSLP